MDIIKIKTKERIYNFNISKDNKTLEIIFGGNGDLYWIIDNKDIDPQTYKEHRQILESPQKETFIITKENYYIYSLFEKLIEEIKEAKIFLQQEDDYFADYEDFSETSEERCNRKNNELKSYFRYKLLYNEGIICWHSDESTYEDATRVKIYKLNDDIILDFSRPPVKREEWIYHISGRMSIRFRNSGSTYDPFNVIFMRMFHKLQDYNPDYHQIHIEEIEYQKKLTRTKK